MIEILMYFALIFILIGYIGYFLMIMIFRNKIVTKSNGFDITKDIISEYNSINVIESRGYFSFYNIKRRVIKLATKCYYGFDISSVSLSLLEAGISVVDNKKNKYIDFLRRIFSNLKILYILPILAIIINNVSYNASDARVSMIFMIFLSFIMYILIDIKKLAYEWIYNNIKKVRDISKDNSLRILKFINRVIWLDKIIFYGEILIIIRMILILLK